MTMNDFEALGLAALVALWGAFLLGFALYLGWRTGSRALPRPTARYRRGQRHDDGWYYEREELDEAPSPLPIEAFGFVPTNPRGVPNWQRLTEPQGLPMIGGRR